MFSQKGHRVNICLSTFQVHVLYSIILMLSRFVFKNKNDVDFCQENQIKSIFASLGLSFPKGGSIFCKRYKFNIFFSGWCWAFVSRGSAKGTPSLESNGVMRQR